MKRIIAAMAIFFIGAGIGSGIACWKLSKFSQELHIDSTEKSQKSQDEPANVQKASIPYEFKYHMTEGIVDPQRMADSHNRARKTVGTQPLKWSVTLAEEARNFAVLLSERGCSLQLDTLQDYGVNLYKIEPIVNPGGAWEWRKADEADVLKAWTASKDWYNPTTGACIAPAGKTCLSYEHVISPLHVIFGCGYAICDDLSQIWICLYRGRNE